MRSLFEQGKTLNAIKETNRLNLERLGISQIRWLGSDKTWVITLSVPSSSLCHYGNDEIVYTELC